MPVQHNARVSDVAYAPRTCVNCGTQWVLKKTIEGYGQELSVLFDGSNTAKRRAMNNLNEKKADVKKDTTNSILCPTCNSLAIQFIEKHCPNGFAASIMKMIIFFSALFRLTTIFYYPHN